MKNFDHFLVCIKPQQTFDSLAAAPCGGGYNLTTAFPRTADSTCPRLGQMSWITSMSTIHHHSWLQFHSLHLFMLNNLTHTPTHTHSQQWCCALLADRTCWVRQQWLSVFFSKSAHILSPFFDSNFNIVLLSLTSLTWQIKSQASTVSSQLFPGLH